jgi:hypothetical protein
MAVHNNHDHDDVSEAFLEYPFCSPCGPEMNYIKAADAPIVFTDLMQRVDDGSWILKTNGDMDVLFQPRHVAMSTTTGRLYHWIETKRLKMFGLLRSQVAVELSQFIDFQSELPHILEWQGQKYAIVATTDILNQPPPLPHIK